MNIKSQKVPVETLRSHSLFIATPMYGGICAGSYTSAMVGLGSACTKMGVRYIYAVLRNESVIDRARNTLADMFLASECTHLVFIDADIAFDPQDVLRLSAIAAETDKHVVAAPYPRKEINWQKVRDAANGGLADDDAELLAHLSGTHAFNPLCEESVKLDAPCEIAEVGMGLTLIPRKTFEVFAEAHPNLRYQAGNRGEPPHWVRAFFQSGIDAATQTHVGEDYAFCRAVRALGLKIWLCPWMRLQHVGSFDYCGSIFAETNLSVTESSGS